MSHPESGGRRPGIAPVIDPARMFLKRKWYKKCHRVLAVVLSCRINNKTLMIARLSRR
jgi:hypothetical protein